nr:ribonuclease H-like domain-containing protein [Tanacetum cinerariifolium]
LINLDLPPREAKKPALIMKLMSLIKDVPSGNVQANMAANQVIGVLQKELQMSKDLHVSPCDICHRAKQTRDPFPLSDHKSSVDSNDGRSDVPSTLHNTENTNDVILATRRSNRQTKLPSKFNNYVVNSNKIYGLEKFVKYSHINTSNFCLSTSLNKSVEPTTFYDVIRDSNWVSAIDVEIEALNRNNT